MSQLTVCPPESALAANCGLVLIILENVSKRVDSHLFRTMLRHTGPFPCKLRGSGEVKSYDTQSAAYSGKAAIDCNPLDPDHLLQDYSIERQQFQPRRMQSSSTVSLLKQSTIHRASLRGVEDEAKYTAPRDAGKPKLDVELQKVSSFDLFEIANVSSDIDCRSEHFRGRNSPEFHMGPVALHGK